MWLRKCIYTCCGDINDPFGERKWFVGSGFLLKRNEVKNCGAREIFPCAFIVIVNDISNFLTMDWLSGFCFVCQCCDNTVEEQSVNGYPAKYICHLLTESEWEYHTCDNNCCHTSYCDNYIFHILNLLFLLLPWGVFFSEIRISNMEIYIHWFDLHFMGCNLQLCKVRWFLFLGNVLCGGRWVLYEEWFML